MIVWLLTTYDVLYVMVDLIYDTYTYFPLAGFRYKRVCYFTNWSQYRPGDAKFQVSNIDSKLCSHIIYAFATMASHKLKAFEWNDEGATGQ